MRREARPELEGFASWVRAARGERTKVAFAAAVGVDPALFVYWEQARCEPTDRTLVLLARATGTAVRDIAPLLPSHAPRGGWGEELRSWRWERLSTEGDVARLVRVSRKAVARWEANGALPQAAAAERLMALGAPPPTFASSARTAFPWVGSKATYAADLLRLVPRTDVYVEPFAGGASLLLARDPVPLEVLNDLDGRLVTLFRVLRDPAASEALARDLALTPYARAEFLQAAAVLSDENAPERAVAWALFVVVNQSVNNRALAFKGDWSAPHAARLREWWRRVAWVGSWHERLASVAVECDDALAVVDRYDTPDTTFFVDPPYLERSSKRLYRHEMSLADHERLADRLLACRGPVVVCGYDSDLYAERFASWETRRLRGRERVWRNERAVAAARDLVEAA